jgi:hypothetical protein
MAWLLLENKKNNWVKRGKEKNQSNKFKESRP